MYKLYEAIPKSQQNLYGQRELDKKENPFLDGPCLLCISAGDIGIEQNVFGTTKRCMEMARMRIRGNINAGFILNDFPVKFLSMLQLSSNNLGSKMTEDERIEAFITQYFLPLVSNKGTKIDCIQAMKNMRNVNMMSYCSGASVIQNIEKKMLSLMQELGYTDEECEKIQSQMCMFPFSTNLLRGTQKSTCISFNDINDSEVNDNVTLSQRKKVQESKIGESSFEYSNNEIAYLFNGDGDHSLKKYIFSGKAMSACLSSALSKALENSILNSQSYSFIPITARSAYQRL